MFSVVRLDDMCRCLRGRYGRHLPASAGHACDLSCKSASDHPTLYLISNQTLLRISRPPASLCPSLLTPAVTLAQLVSLEESPLHGALKSIPRRPFELDPEYEVDPSQLVIMEKIGAPTSMRSIMHRPVQSSLRQAEQMPPVSVNLTGWRSGLNRCSDARPW